MQHVIIYSGSYMPEGAYTYTFICRCIFDYVCNLNQFVYGYVFPSYNNTHMSHSL